MLLMMLFMGLAAINSQANLLFGVFGLMIGVLVIAGFISRIVLRKLEVRRIFPDYVVDPKTAGAADAKAHAPEVVVPAHEVSVTAAVDRIWEVLAAR